VENTTPFPRIFVFPAVSAVFPAVSAMRLPITPWTGASSPGSPPADGDRLDVSPSHRRPTPSPSNPFHNTHRAISITQRPMTGLPAEWLQKLKVTHRQNEPKPSFF
jgi:hypothetical protein